jgi:Outer membrane protein beta-barrel family
MRSILLFLLSVLGGLTASAQRIHIQGHVTDTVSGLKLRDAVVLLANPKDSMLVQFCRTDENGYFKMEKEITPGKFSLFISLPGYVEYFELQELSEQPTNVNIALYPLSRLLKPVVVKGQIKAVSIHGDTLEFNAAAYHAAPNATVDELFRQLPGFQVDKSGRITVNGQTVQKILVDGEEFFSDDPTLVSKTVRADMVDKVQLFDKKSDLAAFAGIHDGKTTKTINLKLKEDKKTGYFGKLGLGGGDKYYNGSALFNRFNGSKKFSVYAIGSNTGEVDISWKDRSDFGIAKDIEYNTPLQTLDNWGGQYSGLGFPQLFTSGAHYNNKWDESKQAISGEARVAKLKLDEKISSTTVYLLPGQKMTSNSEEKNNHTLLQQKYNGNYEIRIDSFTELKTKLNAAISDKRSEKELSTVIQNEAGLPINELTQHIDTREKSNSFAGELFIGRRFRKAGRLLTLGLSGTYNNLDGDGVFISAGKAWDRNTADTPVLLNTNQFKETKSGQSKVNMDLLYRFPISTASSLSFKYAMAAGDAKSYLTTFNIGADGKSMIADSTYSNKYLLRSVGNKAGIHYYFIRKQFQIEAGNDIGITSLDQTNYYNNDRMKRKFTNWFPSAEFKYSDKNGSRTASLSYTGNTILPSVLQLQSLVNNADPNNVVIGNPLLVPAFSNNIRALYINSDFASGKTTWIDISYNVITDDFSTADQIDSIGRKQYQFINSNYSSLFTANLTYSFPLAETVTLGLSGGGNLRNSMNVVNNIENRTKSGNYILGIFLSEALPNKLNITLNVTPSYNYNRSAVQSGSGADYWLLNSKLQAAFFLPLKSELHSNVSMLLRQKTEDFTTNTNAVLWDIWVSKRLLKSEALLVKLAATDILNQATSVFRSISTNYIAESRYDIIQRYFQLSLTWNFSKFPGKQ